ncbi:MAG TPA: FG-GAP repeat protein [Planctomycetota bacterium]|nr:FG-GAP repeat protein [Planctomycetota bacterium]
MKRLPTCVACVLLASAGGTAARAQPPAGDVDTLQQAYVKASNTDSLDHFGDAVAADGDTLVVGAFDERSGATGVDGDQSDDGTFHAGAVYVYVRGGAGWVQQAYLKASNTEEGDEFGDAVAIAGDTLVIGAFGEDSAASGVDGSQGNGLTNSGAAYVFVRDGSGWSQQAYLKASNPGSFDLFGHSLAISGDTIVIGAEQENGIAGDSGAAYVFVRDGSTWTQQAYLKASNADPSDRFGIAVDVDGDTIVVGAFGEDSGATGVDGPQDDESASSSGAAYVFTRQGEVWTQQAYLKASNTDDGDGFGMAVTVSGDTIVVGAPGEDCSSTGVNGHQTNNDAGSAGSAYVFTRTAGSWSQQAYVKASNTSGGDQFGEAVSVSGDALVVGAGRENSAATGINGNQYSEALLDAGAAYFLVRDGGSWSQLAYIKASNTGPDDTFGFSAQISGDLLVVGAYNESGSATGVDGPDDDEAFQSGAAYVFDLGLDPWLPLGFGLAGVAGVPWLSGSGPLTTASAGTLKLADAAPSSLALLFVSLASTPTPFKCGTLAAVPIAFQLPLASNGAGAINLAWGAWPAGLSGLDLTFQAAVLDGAAVCGVSLSNALRARVP